MVRTAKAIARATAEGLVRFKDPAAWLRVMAPTTDDVPGWTEPGRALLPGAVSGLIVADERELDDEYWARVFRVGFEIAAAGHFAGSMAAALRPPPIDPPLQPEKPD